MRAARQRAAALILAAAVLLPGTPAPAQLPGGGFLSLGEGPAVVTLDQERLFAESAFGRRVGDAVETAAQLLSSENRALEAELVAEERALTEARATLAPAEFRDMADAFDARVEGIRARQELRSRAIGAFRDAERQRFLEAALPVLAQVALEAGAVAVLDARTVLLAVEEIDITDQVRARLDAELGDGEGPEVAPIWDDLPDAPPPVADPARPGPGGAAGGTTPRPMPRPTAPAGLPLDLPAPQGGAGGN